MEPVKNQGNETDKKSRNERKQNKVAMDGGTVWPLCGGIAGGGARYLS
jgi:hypothetical protein